MAATGSRTYRNDVQGIRAIGALLVAVFHIWIGGVSGGVDVFFVVSGYFLGSGLLREDGAGRTVGIVAHYERFLCRIVPPALIALAGVTILMFAFVSPTSWETQLREIAASALYVENWWLIRKGQDYLQRGADLSLVQHFWAVSLIGQVQLLWPLLVALALKLARWLNRPGPAVLAGILVVAATASFAISLFATATRPESAYFDLSTRYWQFAIGALIGLQPGLRERLPATVCAALSWLGVGLLLSCGFVIGSTAQFPGYAALWPVGAALLILLGGRENQRANAGHWLAARPLAALGELGFGIYLWHWPMLAILLAARGEKPSLGTGLAIIAAAAALAWITKRLVDGINRFGAGTVRARAFAAVVLTVAIGAEAGNRFVRHLGAQQLAARLPDRTLELIPAAFAAHNDLPIVYQTDCHQNATSARLKQCVFGSERAPFVAVLVGGSHSTHWLPAMQEIAGRRDWRIISMTKSQCIFADFSDAELRRQEEPHASCVQWNDAALREIIRIRPHLVVTIASRMVFSGPDHKAVLSEQIPDGYVRHFTALAREKIAVVAIRDTPWMSRDVPNCVYSPLTDAIQNCGGLRSDVLNDASFRKALARLPANVRLIDMTDAFCSDSQCDVTRNGILMYRDSHHISTTYARALAPLLAERIADNAPPANGGNRTAITATDFRANSAPAAAPPSM